jgi:FMN-dependent oxidoreductase (nitrilotriacetate monooxygenase family)
MYKASTTRSGDDSVSARQLHLNLNAFNTGVYPGSWLLPDASDDGLFSAAHYQNLARIAERGKFDAFFLADAPALGSEAGPRPPFHQGLDPTLLLVAVAGVTSHIGLIATATTTYNAPYDIARRFASLDFISGGRAGWNAVTTAAGRGAAANFGDQPHPERETRYERAGEFIEVVRKLWDSWEDDAIVADREARQYIRRGAITPIDHVGEYFSVKGPLQLPRPPQGHPVVFQAGGSAPGRDLAARDADGIFSLALDRESSRAYVDDIRQRAADHGRDPSTITILPGLVTIIGGTEAEARAMQADLNERGGGGPSIQRLASILEIDPAVLSLDKPVPVELIPRSADDVQGSFAFHNATADIARKGLTVRELLERGGGGHRLLVGAPEQIADSIIDWFVHGAADGFNLMPAAVPSGVEAFVDHVVPLLQARGVFRTDYTGTTLRDHLGLARRESRSRVPAAASV